MCKPVLSQRTRPTRLAAACVHRRKRIVRVAMVCVACCAGPVLLAGGVAAAQVLVIDTSGNVSGSNHGAVTLQVDRRYAQVEPTHVELTNTELDAKTKLLLIRDMESEQGFAMRPFPRGHKGLTLAANGKLSPAGEDYVDMAVSQGISAKPGERLVVTDVKVDRDRMVFDLNGGPEAKRRFMRHVQIGAGPGTQPDPVLEGDGEEATGARLTLTFKDHIPELTTAQVKALLAPLISFDVKTPIEAFTDTLPAPLKKAILDHQVLVGMSMDMVRFAKGQPLTKTREMDGQMPIEIWIFGKPPDDVDFVRFNGNRVLQVEIARMGQPLEVFTEDVVSPMMLASGTPETADTDVHVVREGHVERDPNKEAPAPPPSLRKPGESLPTDTADTQIMKPVRFPKDQQDSDPGANPDDQQPSTPQPTAQPAPANGSQAPAAQQPSTPQPSGQPAAPPSGANQLIAEAGAKPVG